MFLASSGCRFRDLPSFLTQDLSVGDTFATNHTSRRKRIFGVLEYVLLLILLLVSAAFSGAETALFSLRRNEIAKLKSDGGAAGAQVVRLLVKEQDLLSALLIGNLLVNSAASVAATSLILAQTGPKGVAVAVPIITLGLLLFGEITPKLIALNKRQQVAQVVQRPLRYWLVITRPLLSVVAVIVKMVVGAFPWPRTGSQPLSGRELQTACELAVEDGSLSETEGRSLARLLELGELEVVHIMTPRTEVVTLRRDMSLKQVLATARRAGFNRYPVIAGEGSPPEGFFHLKDLLTSQPDAEYPLGEDLRELLYVPESKDVAALLAEMRKGATHLVAVVDEHGDFTGIVTMADCLHALLGPVAEPTGHDQEVVAMGKGLWVVQGRIDTRDFEEACGVSLPASRDYVTVAGFIMAQLGRVPAVGDEVDFAGVCLKVLAMTDHRVDQVEVRRQDDTAGSDEGGEG